MSSELLLEQLRRHLAALQVGLAQDVYGWSHELAREVAAHNGCLDALYPFFVDAWRNQLSRDTVER
eukprot:4696270-Prorocentrum_lima.AAC.1